MLARPTISSAARRDPDGKAVRIALARKVTMNSIAAGERLFVDLMPDGWTGLPPGLPRDVIEELARRAREAERRARQQRMLAQQKQMAPIRVKVVTQPTFSRYVFDLPELISVSADNTRDKLTLTFDAVLSFDLADAKATLPHTIESIDSETDQDAVIVHFKFGAKVDVRTFREDNSYVVDVASAERQGAPQNDTVPSDELQDGCGTGGAAQRAAKQRARAADGAGARRGCRPRPSSCRTGRSRRAPRPPHRRRRPRRRNLSASRRCSTAPAPLPPPAVPQLQPPPQPQAKPPAAAPAGRQAAAGAPAVDERAAPAAFRCSRRLRAPQAAPTAWSARRSSAMATMSA